MQVCICDASFALRARTGGLVVATCRVILREDLGRASNVNVVSSTICNLPSGSMPDLLCNEDAC